MNRTQDASEATRFDVRPSGSKGRGLFAKVRFLRGDCLLALKGRLLSTSELTEDLLALQVGDDLWLCSDGSSLDDFANHSCDPNAGFLDGQPVLYALRDIAPGEEICWDYSTSISENGWYLECACGSSKCRNIIRPWYELLPAEREHLQPFALQYLRRVF